MLDGEVEGRFVRGHQVHLAAEGDGFGRAEAHDHRPQGGEVVFVDAALVTARQVHALVGHAFFAAVDVLNAILGGVERHAHLHRAAGHHDGPQTVLPVLKDTVYVERDAVVGEFPTAGLHLGGEIIDVPLIERPIASVGFQPFDGLFGPDGHNDGVHGFGGFGVFNSGDHGFHFLCGPVVLLCRAAADHVACLAVFVTDLVRREPR